MGLWGEKNKIALIMIKV